MKIQLDTTAKTIKVEENVQFSKLIDTLERLLPNNEWKEFSLETHTTITNWNYPIAIKEIERRQYWNEYPWYCKTGTTTAQYAVEQSRYILNTGTYNVEV